ncbi:MAG: zinc ribbon domain-containing protein [Bacilli bacterium]|mgnify:FL=1|nr:zinc ribbon domain-containing protein [Bacilli bacterium]
MKVCNQCGATTDDDAVFCSSCGAKLEVVEEKGTSDVKEDKPQMVNPTPNEDYVDGSHKAMAMFAYFGILILLPLLISPYKNSKFVRHHANQGLLLTITSVIITMAQTIGGFIPYVRYITALAFGALALVVFIFAIIQIIAVWKGETKEVPVIGKYRIIK